MFCSTQLRGLTIVWTTSVWGLWRSSVFRSADSIASASCKALSKVRSDAVNRQCCIRTSLIPQTRHCLSRLLWPWVELEALNRHRGFWIEMKADNLHKVGVRLVCRLVWCYQTANESISRRPTCTQENCSPLSSIGNFICCKIGIHPLSIACPVLQSAVELSDSAMESHSRTILVASVVTQVLTVWKNSFCAAVQCLYIKHRDRLTPAEQ